MRGLWIEDGEVRLRDDLEPSKEHATEVPVRVRMAGVCATDLALLRGYMGFKGVPGHEFVGIAEGGRFAGRRVVGEINASCGRCERCRGGLGRHCERRSVLGIAGRPGAFCELLYLPEENLHVVPDEVSDEEAVFTEPLAAAFEIKEQLSVRRFARRAVVGDGRLGLMCAQVLALHGTPVDLFGRHPDRAAHLPETIRHQGELDAEASAAAARSYDLVIEASGSEHALPQALRLLRPRGTVVLKTTTEKPTQLDLAPLVVDEITVLGSRCGPFRPALDALAEKTVVVRPWIAARLPLDRGPEAFAKAGEKGVLKVLVDV